MRSIKIWVLGILILITTSLYGQESVYVGMTADEFRTKMPGILPDEMIYDSQLYLKERLHNIDGKWWFGFNGNKLTTANYLGESRITSANEFNKWLESAGLIIEDYTNIYGKPVTHEKGTNKYVDRENRDYEKKIGKRELFEEAVWNTKTMTIKISCDYRSNYFEEFEENTINGPDEWYSHSFQIIYIVLPQMKAVKFDGAGRFYLGMEVNDFAKVFPTLFTEGIGLSGQWMREQELKGLSGSWTYSFKNGKLHWMHFQKYYDEINEANFGLCLNAAKALIKDYSIAYGKPDSVVTGNTEFIDPYVTRHWGYRVLQAHWKDYEGMKMKVEFIFLGGKGEYHFLVAINYFDKDYPYYD